MFVKEIYGWVWTGLIWLKVQTVVNTVINHKMRRISWLADKLQIFQNVFRAVSYWVICPPLLGILYKKWDTPCTALWSVMDRKKIRFYLNRLSTCTFSVCFYVVKCYFRFLGSRIHDRNLALVSIRSDKKNTVLNHESQTALMHGTACLTAQAW